MPLAVNKEATLLESKILSPLHGIRADTHMKKARWSDCPSPRTSCVYSSQVSVLAPWLHFSINSSLRWVTAHRHSACSWRTWSGSHSQCGRAGKTRVWRAGARLSPQDHPGSCSVLSRRLWLHASRSEWMTLFLSCRYEGDLCSILAIVSSRASAEWECYTDLYQVTPDLKVFWLVAPLRSRN